MINSLCSSYSAFSKASTKNFDEPSIIGGSDESSSIMQLSICKPTKAERTCSQV